MKGKQTAVQMTKAKEGWEKYFIISSFASGILQSNSFGCVNVPLKFNEVFGVNEESTVKLICREGLKWYVGYDSNTSKIIGLEHFCKQHMVTQQTIIIFDYVGASKFLVRIYKPCGVEAVYPFMSLKKCDDIVAEDVFSESQYVVGYDTVETEKARALLLLNGFYDRHAYYKMEITDACLFKPQQDLLLRDDMKDLYAHWKHGDTIQLRFTKNTWNIEIKKDGERCFFGPQWSKFCEDAGLENGDLLVLTSDTQTHGVLACIFKNADLVSSHHSSVTDGSSVSFFQFAHQEFLSNGAMVVPLLVQKYYTGHLNKMKTVICGGIEWELRYYILGNHVNGFLPILKKFKVEEDDTIVLTITKNGEASMRIFRRDGMELNYSENGAHSGIAPDHWYLDDESVAVVNMGVRDEEEQVEEELVNNGSSFTEILHTCHVDGRSHGVYISKDLDVDSKSWKSGSTLTLKREDSTWQVGINATNNRKRFSAGWNAFVRDNELQIGDSVTFSLEEDASSFTVEVKHKKKKKKNDDAAA